MTKDYTGVILEDMNGKLDLLLEATAALKDVPRKLDRLTKDVDGLKIDMKAVKTAVTETNRELSGHGKQLLNHEHRIKRLEQPA